MSNLEFYFSPDSLCLLQFNYVLLSVHGQRIEHKNMASSAPKVGLLLKAWHEIPEIVGSSVMAIIGLGFGAASFWLYNAKDGQHKKYKLNYTVYRPDDPRIANIKKHAGLDD